MRYVGCIVVAVLVAGCQSDPYMARKSGYSPGSYHDRYKAIVYASQSDGYRNYKGIHPGSQM